MGTFLFSIRPIYAYRVFAGKKKYELRRNVPWEINRGDRVILYVSGRVQAIMGEFTVGKVIAGPADSVWRRLSSIPDTGITEDLYRYIAGGARAVAVEVVDPIMYRYSVKLSDLRAILPGFNPPLSVMKLDENDPFVKLIANKLREASIRSR